MDELMTVEEVAKQLGMSTTWVRQRMLAEQIPYVQLGGSKRIRPEALEAYLAENTRGGSDG